MVESGSASAGCGPVAKNDHAAQAAGADQGDDRRPPPPRPAAVRRRRRRRDVRRAESGRPSRRSRYSDRRPDGGRRCSRSDAYPAWDVVDRRRGRVAGVSPMNTSASPTSAPAGSAIHGLRSDTVELHREAGAVGGVGASDVRVGRAERGPDPEHQPGAERPSRRPPRPGSAAAPGRGTARPAAPASRPTTAGDHDVPAGAGELALQADLVRGDPLVVDDDADRRGPEPLPDERADHARRRRAAATTSANSTQAGRRGRSSGQASGPQQLLEVGEQRRARRDPVAGRRAASPGSPPGSSSSQADLGHPRVGAQHVLELLDHRRRAPGRGQADHDRAGRAVGEVGDGDLLAVDLGLVLAAGRAGP